MVWLSLPTCKAVFIGNNSPKSGFRRMASPCVKRRSGGGAHRWVWAGSNQLRLRRKKNPRKLGNCKSFEFKFDILHLYW
jgi:hypothetical protein